MGTGFITGVTVAQLRRGSFFRSYQHAFLRERGASVDGVVVEVGAESRYGHQEHFPRATTYLPTNITGEGVTAVDATAMPFADASVDVVVCVSVVEHIRHVEAAFAEMGRILRPGGTLLLTVPFLYPVHDRQDHWRLTDQTLHSLLDDRFDPVEVVRLGGKISTVASLLQRPVGRYSRRDLPLKAFGVVFAAALGRFDQPDDSPLGFAVSARRADGGSRTPS